MNVLEKIWYSLPPEARKAYSSGVNALSDLTTPAAVRDYTGAAQDTARSASQGEGWGTATNALRTANAALGMVPVVGSGVRLAQKGAQEAANALRVYHGSPNANLTELVPGARGPFGPAVYMSPVEHVAQRYAGPSGTMYERSINPDDIFHGIKSSDSRVNPYEVWRQQTARIVDAASPDKKEAVRALAEKMDPSDGYPFFARLSQLYGSQEEAQKLLKSAGYKGISGLVDGQEIAFFESVR
jgi:hypothetical protein